MAARLTLVRGELSAPVAARFIVVGADGADGAGAPKPKHCCRALREGGTKPVRLSVGRPFIL